eukprot:CAMPEP_0197289094 /NCGR_PEP_ID=MMETSP0890-20130614/6296_1 /TAXON_ID=44058 ORGANISM="Aureoumbra lagunensis, Strain CCMP1510" /NCGR_SAMPLE_ID=MMETSP0890 /ASSEMBLY_ACC=CAM_ASM_000533 /LENGTH=109 /DNA_ID=CAMNT_0042760259 /DNA_START=536 /DNA_END=865 /DNA_ORIENTATION=+
MTLQRVPAKPPPPAVVTVPDHIPEPSSKVTQELSDRPPMTVSSRGPHIIFELGKISAALFPLICDPPTLDVPDNNGLKKTLVFRNFPNSNDSTTTSKTNIFKEFINSFS